MIIHGANLTQRAEFGILLKNAVTNELKAKTAARF
jgi:hypothetical protein